MDRARRHQRLLSALAFGLLALVAELVGRSLTHRLDVGRHVAAPAYSSTDYYPFLLAAVKGGIALLLARLAWRFARAHASARAARRLLDTVGSRPSQAPRIRVVLSPRLWLASFLVTALFYLVQTDAEQLSSGRWPLLAPWLHTSALPVFAVLAVLVAVLWGAVAGWLADYERFAEATVAHAYRAVRSLHTLPSRRTTDARPPRRLFGLAFESRPPPVFA
ncbi:MAG: hypothetical protein E6F93_09980 [Actinobacteria bacterium]|nr:MAG: hypothetical protein E6G21_12000 [Actinomycetota bacterium]TMM29796.1 MAG: hypothetical protein E6F93_09980 [Actinomycetota bacterium]